MMAERFEIRALELEEAKSLAYGDLVYVLYNGKSSFEPAMVAKMAIPGVVHLVMADDMLARDVTLRYSDYGVTYRIGVQDALCVKTPGGTIMVKDKRDGTYPGISVEVYDEHQEKKTLITMVEYIPGGEGLCSYMPNDIEQMRKELNEVPMERISDKVSGEPISKEDFACLSVFAAAQSNCRYEVSPGFVSRAWQNASDEEAYNRTFHTGI